MKVFLKILLNICIIILAFLLGQISDSDIFNKLCSKFINKNGVINTNNSGTIIELEVIEDDNKNTTKN